MMIKPPAYSKIKQPFLHPPTFLEYKDIRFLITDAPSINNMSTYINEFQQWNVTDVVRCCKATYSNSALNDYGIEVHDYIFPDGEPPPKLVIDQWLDLIDARFKDETKKEEGPCIAAHCVAGLGRAPVLVAIALVEAGMDSLDAVAFVRKHRHGAISNKQLRYIEKYKKRSHSSCCIS